MSDLFNHPILTVRIHAGFNANVFLAGLLALTGQTAGTAQAYMARRFPEVDAIIEFGPRAVNGILGHTLSIRTPHEHVHRTPADILRHYEASTLSDEAKAKAAAIWSVVANAEARVHGTTPDHVHFHEVGRMANIIAVGLIADFMTTIDPAMIVASPLPMTDGTVNCAHGVVPYPAPALYAMLDGVAVRPWDWRSCWGSVHASAAGPRWSSPTTSPSSRRRSSRASPTARSWPSASPFPQPSERHDACLRRSSS